MLHQKTTALTLSLSALLVMGCGAPSDQMTKSSVSDPMSSALVTSTTTSLFDKNACSLSPSGTLTLTTLWMPKGDFTTKGSFDATKTPLVVTGTVAAGAACLAEGAANISFTSLQHDSTYTSAFMDAYNPNAKEIAYSWTMTADLAEYQNHWHKVFACDGSYTIAGCNSPRDVTLTIEAQYKNGGVKASDSISLTLAAVQDPDVPATGCQAPPADPCASAAAYGEIVANKNLCSANGTIQVQFQGSFGTTATLAITGLNFNTTVPVDRAGDSCNYHYNWNPEPGMTAGEYHFAVTGNDNLLDFSASLSCGEDHGNPHQ